MTYNFCFCCGVKLASLAVPYFDRWDWNCSNSKWWHVWMVYIVNMWQMRLRKWWQMHAHTYITTHFEQWNDWCELITWKRMTHRFRAIANLLIEFMCTSFAMLYSTSTERTLFCSFYQMCRHTWKITFVIHC